MKIKTLVYPSVLILILVNSIPILGVLFFSWDIFSILFLYWLETIVIGFFNILKILAINKTKGIFLVIFFIIHYGLFNWVHLLFLVSIFTIKSSLSGPWFLNLDKILEYLNIVILALIPLFLSHGFSLFYNFFKNKEYLKTNIVKQMKAPYKRIVSMQLVIILSSLPVFLFKQNIIAIVLLVLLKIFFDISGHIAEHYSLLKKVNKV